MGYYLVFTFIIAIIAIIYIWYASREINSISDDKILSLETREDRILSNWYKQNIKPSFNFDLDENVIAAKFLHRIYDLEINPDLLVIGTDLASQYTSLSQQSLISGMNHTPASDCIFDIRSSIGKEGEIAIIHDVRIRSILRNNNNYDPIELNAVLEYELDIIARDYLKTVMKYRWDKLIQLNNPNLINKEGTFAYFTDFNIPNVQTANTKQGVRINLLCTDLEFETLIKRCSSHLPQSIEGQI